jgi:DMSO/TMAO reductase YedYZ molybdopterin-dependent catalytic subunit
MHILTIEGEGLVRRNLEFAELRALPEQLAHRSTLFHGRDVVGVSLASLLRLIEPRASARYVRFTSADGYSTTLALAAVGDAQLVYRIGDEQLPPKLGGPVRLVVSAPTPRSCLKYVTTLSLTAEPAQERLPECDHHETRAA